MKKRATESKERTKIALQNYDNWSNNDDNNDYDKNAYNFRLYMFIIYLTDVTFN